jgi:excisionase family DNA binding protein
MYGEGWLAMSTSTGKPFERLLNVYEVANVLQVHPTTVRRWQKKGELKSYRLGPKGSLRFRKEDVLKFVEGSVNL